MTQVSPSAFFSLMMLLEAPGLRRAREAVSAKAHSRKKSTTVAVWALSPNKVHPSLMKVQSSATSVQL